MSKRTKIVLPKDERKEAHRWESHEDREEHIEGHILRHLESIDKRLLEVEKALKKLGAMPSSITIQKA